MEGMPMRPSPSNAGRSKLAVLVVLLALAGIGYFGIYPALFPKDPFSAVRGEAEELAAKCRSRGPAPEQLRFPTKILIWDARTGKRSAAQRHLAESLQANKPHDLGTLVLVLGLNKEETSEYMPLEGTTMGGPVEYRYIYTLGVVAWPDRQIGGTYEVILDPPSMRGGEPDTRKGNWFDLDLADWVAKRARTN
jgi:hypothetical protein